MNAKRFKFLWGLLPDHTIRGNWDDWKSKLQGKGAECVVCGEILFNDSNEHMLLICPAPDVVAARRLWLRRIQASVGRAEFPPSLERDLRSAWSLHYKVIY